MSKLPKAYKFLDLSDYGRSMAYQIAYALKDTKTTPIQVTMAFIVSGLLAIASIYYGFKWAAAFFLVLKSILDAADGELSRLKEKPSYVGRYFDSIADIILNFLFLLVFWFITDASWLSFILGFIAIQLQGTLYNYYYVILRNSVNGDSTSRVFENKTPTAYPGESQRSVDVYYRIFNFLYWFMTILSTMGLGFQLLIMGVMVILNLEEYVIPFFIFYSVLILLLVGIRRFVLD